MGSNRFRPLEPGPVLEKIQILVDLELYDPLPPDTSEQLHAMMKLLLPRIAERGALSSLVSPG
jgi:hypothetical protein